MQFWSGDTASTSAAFHSSHLGNAVLPSRALAETGLASPGPRVLTPGCRSVPISQLQQFRGSKHGAGCRHRRIPQQARPPPPLVLTILPAPAREPRRRSPLTAPGTEGRRRRQVALREDAAELRAAPRRRSGSAARVGCPPDPASPGNEWPRVPGRVRSGGGRRGSTSAAGGQPTRGRGARRCPAMARAGARAERPKLLWPLWPAGDGPDAPAAKDGERGCGWERARRTGRRRCRDERCPTRLRCPAPLHTPAASLRGGLVAAAAQGSGLRENPGPGLGLLRAARSWEKERWWERGQTLQSLAWGTGKVGAPQPSHRLKSSRSNT